MHLGVAVERHDLAGYPYTFAQVVRLRVGGKASQVFGIDDQPERVGGIRIGVEVQKDSAARRSVGAFDDTFDRDDLTDMRMRLGP